MVSFYLNYPLNNNPLHVEIGMGKGQFLTTLAKENPDINYIGIERYTSVLLRAIQKVEDEDIPNLRFICFDAADILDIFSCHEVDRIYLNFSDPWPKERHAKRRLTSSVFLSLYDSIFRDRCVINMKTDNRKLFEYSIMSLTSYGYSIDFLSLDLYSDDVSDNVQTEYEKKFVSNGNLIYMISVHK